MSRIGRQPINIADGVQIQISDRSIELKGPKGELKVKIMNGLEVKQEEGSLIVSKKIENSQTQKLYGLQRSLIANAVQGVSEGFTKELEINGVGFRAQMKGTDLEMSLGFSHPILYSPPAGVNVSVNQNIIVVAGHDKQLVGEVAANIRKFKKPEPYKGKGIKYSDEKIRRKAGKAAAKGGSE